MGIIAAFFATAFSSTKDLLSKKISFSVDGTSSAFASFAFALPFYLLLLIGLVVFAPGQLAITGPFFFYVILRCSSDVLAETCKMHSFTHGDISLLGNFLSLSPLFLLLTSPIITGDAITKGELVGILLIVLGSIILVYKPKKNLAGVPVKGIILAILASFFLSLNTVFDRLASQQSSPIVAGAAMTVIAALVLLPFMLLKKQGIKNLTTHKKPFLLRGLAETAFMIAKLFALQTLTAPMVMGVIQSSVLISVIGGGVLFKEKDMGRKFLASAIVFVGLLVILLPL